MKDKELLCLLQKNGWLLDRINGSHYILVKDNTSSQGTLSLKALTSPFLRFVVNLKSDNIPADSRQGYEKRVRNRNPKESGSKVKANAGASPQGV